MCNEEKIMSGEKTGDSRIDFKCSCESNTKAQWDLLNVRITPIDIIIDILQNNIYKLLIFVFQNLPSGCPLSLQD